MKTKKTLARRFKPPNKRAVSSVITTLVISSVLLIILVIAAYVSTNILTVQMASTEFEQAQSNMLLLDSTIQDVALRPGAGGYVQFNEREGGIGINQTTNTLAIYATNGSRGTTTNGTDFVTYSDNLPNLIQLVYSGGSLASAAVNQSTGIQTLRGNPGHDFVNLTQDLSFLRLAQDNGAKIKLDYDRVRIISTGLIDSRGTNLVQVTFINLTKGDITTGSGTVDVMVQNVESMPTVWSFEGPSNVSITLHYPTDPSQFPQTWPPDEGARPSGTTRTVVVFSVIQIKVSLR